MAPDASCLLVRVPDALELRGPVVRRVSVQSSCVPVCIHFRVHSCVHKRCARVLCVFTTALLLFGHAMCCADGTGTHAGIHWWWCEQHATCRCSCACVVATLKSVKSGGAWCPNMSPRGDSRPTLRSCQHMSAWLRHSCEATTLCTVPVCLVLS